LDGVGFEGAGGGPAAPPVVKDHVGDVPMSDGLTGVALVRDTTFQKYVVPDCRAVVGLNEYVLGGVDVIWAATLPASVIVDGDVPM
jgi:hypothetical protein